MPSFIRPAGTCKNSHQARSNKSLPTTGESSLEYLYLNYGNFSNPFACSFVLFFITKNRVKWKKE